MNLEESLSYFLYKIQTFKKFYQVDKGEQITFNLKSNPSLLLFTNYLRKTYCFLQTKSSKNTIIKLRVTSFRKIITILVLYDYHPHTDRENHDYDILGKCCHLLNFL